MNKSLHQEINIDNLALIRVFALVLVVLRHSFAPFMGLWNLPDIYPNSEITQIIGKYISTISMPLYVFISGVLFSFLRNKLHKYETFQILIKKKTKRLVIPYLFFAPIYIYLFIPFKTTNEFLFSFFQGAGHLWFLLMIFIVFIIFYLLENIFKKYPIKSFLIITACFFLFPGLYYLQLDPLAKAFQYMPYFYFGYFFYYNSATIFNYLKNKTPILILIHSLVFLLSVWFPSQLSSALYKALFKGYIILPMGLLSVSFIFIIFYNISIARYNWLNITITNINKTSYYIYILHQPLLIYLYQEGYLKYWSPIAIIITSFTVVFLISLILSNFIMKLKLGRKLIGAA
ncbi:acyltransferase family protein [Maribacter forsetii]|uniref:acyltransferase family protein n=1 Tax=Maribacter forsetii TaxID=444515 RepID=UPI0005612FBE|nr:acyltransferase [Maribacter forsetii]